MSIRRLVVVNTLMAVGIGLMVSGSTGNKPLGCIAWGFSQALFLNFVTIVGVLKETRKAALGGRR